MENKRLCLMVVLQRVLTSQHRPQPQQQRWQTNLRQTSMEMEKLSLMVMLQKVLTF